MGRRFVPSYAVDGRSRLARPTVSYETVEARNRSYWSVRFAAGFLWNIVDRNLPVGPRYRKTTLLIRGNNDVFRETGRESLMPKEAFDSAPVCLNGLTLAEAFRKHVIEDGEVAVMARRLAEAGRRHSSVFSKGHFPGPIVAFHWPLHATSESIVYAFVDSSSPSLEEPSRTPSELETTVSRMLSERIAMLIGYLAHGELIAIGTFAATGTEAPIGRGQWTRNLSVDLSNSDVCELRDHRHVAVWTGVFLQLPDQKDNYIAVTQDAGNESTKARKQIQTKDNHRRECIAWLISIMSNPSASIRTNEELWAEAASKWPGTVSEREFARCRRDALAGISEEQRYIWGRPGPKRRRS